ncbi:MAG: hypothetical protein JXM73_00355 [Anaerolineae bacterium]|nr:hypothetical protein [Anaerolineae bacterium]
MDRRSLRRFGIASALGGGFVFVVLLCLGVALVRSINPLPQLTAEAGVAVTHSPVPLTAETPAITATLLLPTDTPTATDTPLPTDTPTPSPTLTDTPLPTDTPVPSPTDTGTLPPTDTPSPSPTPTDTPTPSPTPVPLAVQGSTVYEKANGDLHVVGEVINSTDGSICDVKIVGTFYDSVDQVVEIGFVYTMLDIVGASEAAPFDLVLLDPPSTVDNYDLQVEYAITDSAPLRLEVASHQGSISNSDYHVLGEVRNQNAFTVNSVRVVATFYNDQDEVLRTVIYYTILDTLSSGQKASYDVTVPDPPDDLDHYALIVEADRQ